MTEPKTARGRERKTAIVSAAAALIYRRGARATTVEDVLVASGSGKSQLYHYFSSKDDLLAAVVEYQLAGVLGALGEFRVDTWSGLRAWFDALLEGQEQRRFDGCPVGSLALELSASGPELQARGAEALSRWESVLSDAFESMRTKGLLGPAAPPTLLAQATLALLQGGYLLSTASQDIRPMRTALNTAYNDLRAWRIVEIRD